MRSALMIADLLGPNAPALPAGSILERKRWTFWDDTTVLAAASPIAGDYAFFQTPAGSGAKTRFNTNFHGQGGQLPAGNYFQILGIGVAFALTLRQSITTITIAADAADFFNNLIYQGVLTLETGGSKKEIDGVPLVKFGQGCGETGHSMGGTNITAAAAAGGGFVHPNNGVAAEASLYDLGSEPIVLTPGRNFQVQLSWTAAGVTIPANNGARMMVFLEGYLHRPA